MRMLRVTRVTRVTGMPRVTRIAWQTGHAIACRQGDYLTRIAAEGFDATADDFEIAVKNRIPAVGGRNSFADPFENGEIPLFRQ